MKTSFDKKSVRQEIDRFNREFERLDSEKKINGELRVLIKGMLMLFSLLISIFLEKKIIKTNKNSSKPPSQTEKDQ